MLTNTPKRIHNPVPPEFANVSTLRLITVGVALICLTVTSYATWTVYVMSNRISTYETDFRAEAVSKSAGPVNFTLFEQVLRTDAEKQNLKFIPPTRDPFYDRAITSTMNGLHSGPTTTASSTPSTSTTQL
ncbi:MAG TPA: hypothetical protein PK295_02690 [Candidatus Magasanikbacteria bacterium]|nr:hypothetical protein [Candidatus Magasanikbacteria bacterium]